MSERLTDEELTEALEVAQGMRSLRLTAAIAELRERRMADLSAEDKEALRKAREIVMGSGRDVDRRIRTVLDRLLLGATP